MNINNSIIITVQTGVPVLLISEPGTGKSAWTTSLASALACHQETLIGSLMDPTDVGGMPMRVNGHCEFAPPGWFTRLKQAPKGGLLFIDELTCCPPSVQAPLLRLVAERSLHAGTLPDSTLIMAACNPPDQAAGGYDIAPPMANRFAHFQWAPTVDDWVMGMVSGWPKVNAPVLPANWHQHIPNARALVSSYIRSNPAALQALPGNEAERSGPWPSRRTWDMAARVIAGHDALHAAPDEAVAALVGPTAAIAFMQWRKSQNLPDPETVLAEADKFVMPEREDIAFTVYNSVTAAVIGNFTPDRFDRAFRVLGSAVRAGKPDLVIVPARALAASSPSSAITTMPKSLQVFLPVLKAAGLL